MKIAHNTDYGERRAADYPSVEDQLDAIWKQLAEGRAAGSLLVPAAETMLNRVLEVKRRYPKP